MLITGAAGMLGSALVRACGGDAACTPATRADADLTHAPAVAELLDSVQPDCVIHAAAYTDVDGCTRDPDRAMRNNAEATGILASACQSREIRLVAVGSEYVFSGTRHQPYGVDDPVDPINPYGRSKAAAEAEIAARMSDYLIVRTQWLYGPGGGNFVSAILNRARDGKPLKVVDDEFGSPTYTADLADALLEAAVSDLTGIVHITNSGVCSRL